MKLTHRIKQKSALGIGKFPFVPIGYFGNRPKLQQRMFGGGIGRVESVRFVLSSVWRLNARAASTRMD